MTRAAIYVRVSTARQAERDLSLPDQIARCRAYCEQKGWEVAEIFSEPGASALDEGRPVFQEMIYKAKRPDHPFNVVVVHSLSRFSRDALHSEFYVRQLNKAGVQLISVTQDIAADAGGEFIRKVLNVFDEHQSRENAKHVHRAMCENARQGFWNGARPPYGYAVQIKDRRGNKDKKVLIVDEAEARVVRLIFDMACGADGRAMGVKAIASWLNERAYSRRGRRFSTGSVYEILTSTTYHGQHYFNRTDSRNRKPRPQSEWIPFTVPPIVDEDLFNMVQALLASRAPKRTPPRVVNPATLLAGIARCGYCGAAMIQNTGKGGAYRYYCCSRRLKEGTLACQGVRIPMDRLDDTVTKEVVRRVLQPDHLRDLLEEFVRISADRESEARERLARIRQQHKEAEAGIARLLQLVEQGLMEPTLTEEKVEQAADLLKSRLRAGPVELRRDYARMIMNEVAVTDREIRISGPKSILARYASQAETPVPPGVLSFVQEWRTRQDSNL